MSPSRPSIHDTNPDELAPQSSKKLTELDVIVRQHTKELEDLREEIDKNRANNDDRSRQTKIDRIQRLEDENKSLKSELHNIRQQADHKLPDVVKSGLLLIFGGAAAKIGEWIFTKLSH